MTVSAGPARPRRVVGWITVSLDGYSSGPDGPAADTWLTSHATNESALAYFENIWRSATTALLGRTNYEGFAAVWPGITADPASDERTRDIGRWLAEVEKVVFSRTLESAEWTNSRVATDLEAEVGAVTAQPGRDVIVLCSASIIAQLITLDLLDDLQIVIVPVTLGGGLRVLPEGTGLREWHLVQSTTMDDGALGLHYRRRSASEATEGE